MWSFAFCQTKRGGFKKTLGHVWIGPYVSSWNFFLNNWDRHLGATMLKVTWMCRCFKCQCCFHEQSDEVPTWPHGGAVSIYELLLIGINSLPLQLVAVVHLQVLLNDILMLFLLHVMLYYWNEHDPSSTLPGLHELSAINDQEVKDFRSKMARISEERMKKIEIMTYTEWLQASYSPQLELTADTTIMECNDRPADLKVIIHFDQSQVRAKFLYKELV